jgi:hypothetical protein
VISDVSVILISEVANRRQHRIGSALAQAAHGSSHYLLSQFYQEFDVAFPTLSLCYAIEDLEHPLRAYAARRTFPT